MSTTIVPDQPADAPSFETRPTLQYAATVGMQAALVGAFVSSVQNALGSHSKGATGFLSRTGGTIGFFGRSQNNISPSLNNIFIKQLQWVQRLLPPSPSSRTNEKSRMR
jgi:hypothetical protein